MQFLDMPGCVPNDALAVHAHFVAQRFGRLPIITLIYNRTGGSFQRRTATFVRCDVLIIVSLCCGI